MRLDPSCDVFTSLHLLLTRFCLRARAYTSVLPVLDKHICHLPLSTPCSPSKPSTIMCTSHDSGLFFITDSSGLSSKLTYKDYLQYFLYGGMIYLALKKWRKAAHFFGIVISMPTGGPVSMVMVEAYKKWILVSLLEKGKLCPPPSISSPQVIRVLQSLAKPYINLAYAFEQGDLRRLGAEIDAARDIWCTDNNMGLVSQVMNAYSKHTIIGIKKTFAALTVADLTKQAVSLWATTDAAESTIASLIMTGAIQATLVQSQADNGAAMLRFFATASLPQILQETKVQSHLQCERGSMAALMRNLDQRNHGMALSDELIDSMQKGQTWSTVGEVGVGLGTDAGLEMDEDLMGE
ncbi:hypothetical protein N7462_009877 [Penicillium macrosclerotiorum]|uniref:uncharacterized protein n=1 Tax=Penicillium macrosclerotiorum TaxID=303699 RepID=UPI002547EAE1|nr:uncharacterized protein N7462_009877 [Penicillium macrosclerotiorum]KAJ5668807.1 hypothetical protein N7462_009877 [Penicillium macrosclerotiorum]